MATRDVLRTALALRQALVQSGSSLREVTATAYRAARTATLETAGAAMNVVLPGSGTVMTLLANSSKARRVALALIGMAAAAAMLLGFVIVGTAVQISQTPQRIASSVLGWIPGSGDEDDPSAIPAERMCLPQQVARPTTYAPATTTSSPSPEAEPVSEDLPSTESPEDVMPSPEPDQTDRHAMAVLSDNGRITDRAMELASMVPAGVSARQANAWLLFAMAHPGDPRVADWNTFTILYEQATKIVSAQASGADIAATMDPTADYRPYILAASALTVAGIADDKWPGTPDMMESAVQAMTAACMDNSAAQTSANLPVATDPVLPADHPGWRPTTTTAPVNPTTPVSPSPSTTERGRP